MLDSLQFKAKLILLYNLCDITEYVLVMVDVFLYDLYIVVYVDQEVGESADKVVLIIYFNKKII